MQMEITVLRHPSPPLDRVRGNRLISPRSPSRISEKSMTEGREGKPPPAKFSKAISEEFGGEGARQISLSGYLQGDQLIRESVY